MAFDLDTYRAQAEEFVSDVDREYYLHFSGQKPTFELEAIYDRNGELFSAAVVDDLRSRLAGTPEGDDRRRLLCLLRLAVDGLIGQATKCQAEELAEREGSITIEIDGQQVAYRSSAVMLAAEPDPDRRRSIDAARLDALTNKLNPLLVEMLEQSHACAANLGWSSYADMYGELKSLDIAALQAQTSAFLDATRDIYRELVDGPIRKQLGYGLDDLRRCDMGHFFRAPEFDRLFTPERLVPSFNETLTAMGFDPSTQTNVILDLEQRPIKSPRAFCAPVRVPDEIYLVMPIGGGREDYATLFHEGGHTEHYAHVDASLPFEFRHLGDNSVTESFAFLLENLTEDESWLRTCMNVTDSGDYIGFTHAAKLVFLRRYAAKLDYELQLHSGKLPLAEMPALYARELGGSIEIDWPEATYLSDVDDGFYVANYLRAWALETHWRKALRERFGSEWFMEREAGRFLEGLWSQGQRLDGDELLREVLGEQLDFSALAGQFVTV